MKDCNPGDFVFSVGLRPGPTKIRSEQITRRWETHVKLKLGVTVDFYAHKHANTTEIIDEQDNNENDAAALNSHTSTAMVINIYDVKQQYRQHERLKKINNSYI
jgi:hypothetical protein